jgi:hypothetical protein
LAHMPAQEGLGHSETHRRPRKAAHLGYADKGFDLFEVHGLIWNIVVKGISIIYNS